MKKFMILLAVLMSFVLFTPNYNYASDKPSCVVLIPITQCKVFQANDFRAVEERINEWLLKNKNFNIVAVSQSECFSDLGADNVSLWTQQGKRAKRAQRATITIFYKKYDSEL